MLPAKLGECLAKRLNPKIIRAIGPFDAVQESGDIYELQWAGRPRNTNQATCWRFSNMLVVGGNISDARPTAILFGADACTICIRVARAIRLD